MLKILLPLIFSEKFFQKIMAYGTILLLGYFLYDFLVFFFIIFICAYIFLKSGEEIASQLHNW